MALIVQKYGGTSVADADRIRHVAGRVVKRINQGDQVIVVVSAMGNSTDDLIDLALQVAPDPDPRELDMLLSTGEQVSVALVAMALKTLGQEAVGLTGQQAGIIAQGRHYQGRISRVEADRAAAWAALKRDKKGEGVFVLLEGPGRPVVTDVPDTEARPALEALIRK